MGILEEVMGQGEVSVLVVNSDSGMREYLCELLPDAGVNPICSDSIRCALEKIAELHVDAIICDERLKDGFGIELVERLRRCGSKAPVAMLLSGNPGISEISALARGADLVFQKPFGLQDFIDGIQTLIGYADERIPSADSLNAQSAWSSTDSTRNSPHRA